MLIAKVGYTHKSIDRKGILYPHFFNAFPQRYSTYLATKPRFSLISHLCNKESLSKYMRSSIIRHSNRFLGGYNDSRKTDVMFKTRALR